MYERAEKRRTPHTERKGDVFSGAGGAMQGVIPNSTMMSILDGDRSNGISDFDAKMKSRFESLQIRPQAQIPRAENEADRLSAAVNVGTPESVKAVMGQRMGADFSGVRFHTDAAAASKADAMGARLYQRCGCVLWQ